MESSEFLSAVYEVIRLNYPPAAPEGISAAQVGVLVRRAFPDLDWESIGFPKLKHILASLEAQGLIRTGRDSKQALSIWLRDIGGFGLPSQQQSVPRNSLRKEVWNAFVLTLPHGRRYFQRSNGTVRMATKSAPDSTGEWVEIEAIPQSVQKSWAEGFLKSHELSSINSLVSILDSEEWYRSLRDELTKSNPTLVTDWNRVRTQNVVAHVRQWCEENAIPDGLVFEHTRTIGLPTHPPAASIPDVRAAILHAVSRMSLEELLQIRMPAKYLVEHLFSPIPRDADPFREAGR